MKSQACIQQNVSLQPYNTLALPAIARYYTTVVSLDDIQKALAYSQKKQLPFYVLGGGSNTVFAGDYYGVIIHIAMRGINKVSEDATSVTLQVAAGENWDTFLQYCLANHYYGLENLAIIPGTVGAAPIQNIGAYGLEVAQCIDSVEAWDTETQQLQVLSNDQCQFAYRDSVFKQQQGRYIVIAVNFRLAKQFTANLSYRALRESLQDKPVSASRLREAVIALRTSRLPAIEIWPNAGSFFKNPVISAEQFNQLQKQYPAMPNFHQQDSIKIPAAWLIEQCGWKGKRLGTVAMYEKHALVLVNLGHATFADVKRLTERIIEDVKNTFSIHLEPEPLFLSSMDNASQQNTSTECL